MDSIEHLFWEELGRNFEFPLVCLWGHWQRQVLFIDLPVGTQAMAFAIVRVLTNNLHTNYS